MSTNSKPGVIVADGDNQASVDAMVAQSKYVTIVSFNFVEGYPSDGCLDVYFALYFRRRVVISTVGPFTKYGEVLVAACVRNGTDYCDITGESTWVADMIAKYGAEAKKNGEAVSLDLLVLCPLPRPHPPLQALFWCQ